MAFEGYPASAAFDHVISCILPRSSNSRLHSTNIDIMDKQFVHSNGRLGFLPNDLDE
jgi:hypothetical protein